MQKIKEHFDSYSKDSEWSRLYMSPPTSFNWSFLIRKQRVLELIDSQEGKILDIGCGPGIITEEIINKNYDYFGIDISPEMIEEARRKFSDYIFSSKINLSVGDITKIDFPDTYFDGITCMGLFEYLGDFNMALKETNRALKQNGFLIVTAPLKYQLDRFMVMLLAPLRIILASTYHKLRNINPRPIKRNFFTPSQLDFLMAKFGFKKDDFAYYNFTFLPYPFTVLFPRFTYFLNKKMERFYKRHTISFFATGYIAKYRKT